MSGNVKMHDTAPIMAEGERPFGHAVDERA
jgi:hypothetical protein